MHSPDPTGVLMSYRASMARSTKHLWLGPASVVAALAFAAQAAAQTATFVAPPVFASSEGVLDILMTAKAKAIPTITFTSPTTGQKINPQGWAYEICRRTSSGQTSCPPGPGTVWAYGGVRLALQQSDTLKIPFANQLPPFDPNKLLNGPNE